MKICLSLEVIAEISRILLQDYLSFCVGSKWVLMWRNSCCKKWTTSILCWNKAKGAVEFWDRASLFRLDWPRTHGSPLPQLPKCWACRHEPPYLPRMLLYDVCSIFQDILWHVTLTDQGLDNMSLNSQKPSGLQHSIVSADRGKSGLHCILPISRRLLDRILTQEMSL